MKNKMLGDRPSVLRIGAGLGVGKPGIRRAGKGGLADESAVDAECQDFRAQRGLGIGKAGDVESGGELMCAVPEARDGEHVADSLQAAAALM